MTDDAHLPIFEIVQQERNRVEKELQGVYVNLAGLVGTYADRGAIPVAEIRALVPGLTP